MTRGLILVIVLLAAGPSLGDAQPARSDNPHGSLQSITDCDACHTASAWKPLKARTAFNHNSVSSFLLAGKHEEATCKSCHLDLRFDTPKIAASDCGSCHLDVHLGQLSSECAMCHTTRDFVEIPALTIHSRTSFPLSGSHLQISCESCHLDDRGGAFSTLLTDCVACHQKDYISAVRVDHVAQNFPTECERCHNTLAWSGGGVFDHIVASNGFALSGAHATLNCAECHDPSSNALLFPPPADSNDCIACHESDYQRQHGGSGTPTSCVDCHSDATWSGADFEHLTASSGFALLGAHATLDCTVCHDPVSNALLFPPPSGQNDCIACHQDDYDRQHTGTGFNSSCLECHTQTTWAGASFDHTTAANGFALLGAHATLDCTVCHDPVSNALLFPPPSGQNDCIACHQDDYDRQHSGTGFTTSCLECHTQTTWAGASFDHATASNGFALLGAHGALDCTVCHDPVSNALLFPPPSGQNDCIACHQDDYDRQHAGTGFSTSCLDCHTQTTWTGAVFQHDQLFPINSGVHSGKWNGCDTCHTVPSDYTSFTCFNCHQHDQTRMDNKHSSVGGYTYESSACYSCHPNGRK